MNTPHPNPLPQGERGKVRNGERVGRIRRGMVLLSTVWDGRWLVYRLQAAQRRPAEAGTPAAGISNIVLKSVLFASERPPYPKI